MACSVVICSRLIKNVDALDGAFKERPKGKKNLLTNSDKHGWSILYDFIFNSAIFQSLLSVLIRCVPRQWGYKDKIDTVSILNILQFSGEGLLFWVGPQLLGCSFLHLLALTMDVTPSASAAML